MALNRVVAELPGSVEELCLVRFGLVVRRLSAVGFVRKMAREVGRATADGLLESERFSMGWRHVGVLQYWTSFDALDAWSHRSPHAEWWRSAVDRMRTKGDFGVYHEAFAVSRADVETIYLDCPPIGLARFGTIGDPVGPKTTARDRLGRRSS